MLIVSLATALTSVANALHGPFFARVGQWCAISDGYTIELFVVYIVPVSYLGFTLNLRLRVSLIKLIVTSLIVSVLYVLIYLCLRGTLVIGKGVQLRLSPDDIRGAFGRLNNDAEYQYFLRSIGKSLLWFPFGVFS